MTPYVLGLDLSLTSAGVATIDVDLAVTTRVEKSIAAGDELQPRWDRLTDMRRRILGPHLDLAHLPALAVVEGPSYGQRQQSGVHDRAGLWWLVVGRLLDDGVPLAYAAPQTRAKWPTGKGNATKAEVSVACARLWPSVQARFEDEWDALSLCSLGAQHLGWDVPRRAHHAACQDAIDWPATVAAS